MKKILLLLLFLGACTTVQPIDSTGTYDEAYFAGGCFWCSEAAFQETPGVVDAISGYAGGQEVNPTYEQVSSGKTSHVEAVRVVYDSNNVTYEELLEVYWTHIDPTDDGGQFADRGTQYKTVIFYMNEEERVMAEQTKVEITERFAFEDPVLTSILPFTTFYEAEEYHQDYYLKAPLRYKSYETLSGRKGFVEETYE